MDIRLTRTTLTSTLTLGTLQVGDQSFFTIEQPWANNVPQHSCIPPGTYQLDTCWNFEAQVKVGKKVEEAVIQVVRIRLDR